MSQAPKRRRCMTEEDLQNESETQDLMDMQVPRAVEEDTYPSSSSSTCSSSFPSSSSTSTSYVLMPSPQEEDFAATETPSLSQSPQRASSSSVAMALTPQSQSGEGCSNQMEECPSTSQHLSGIESLPISDIQEKSAALVEFLLLKYRMKELTTRAEMLNAVIKDHPDHFSLIFTEASQYLKLVFGIDVKEVDPSGHSYVLVTSLGLTYDGLQSEVQGIPKAGLLILLLSLIFMKGNRAPEEEIWRVLSMIGVCAGREHYMYGDPRKFITEDLVQEQYLAYEQVPNSDPARYEFLWGPRAHAEISKMKILEFLTNISGSDPRSFPVWYEEALRDEEGRA